MQELFAIALGSLQQDMSRLDHVASNLANVGTPGYKRQVAAVRPFTELVQDGAAASAGAALQVRADLSAGTLRTTGQPLDLAIAGEGYFEVLTEQGAAYTRKGDFKVDAQGRLATADGHPVMARRGDLRLSGRTPVIDETGHVTELSADGAGASVALGDLKVVRFEKPELLHRLGNGLLAADADAGMQVLSDAEVRVRQGTLENSNVNSTREMVELMQTMRHFESVHRAIQGYDEMVGGAVRKLAEG